MALMGYELGKIAYEAYCAAMGWKMAPRRKQTGPYRWNKPKGARHWDDLCFEPGGEGYAWIEAALEANRA